MCYQKRKTIDLTVEEFKQTRTISYELLRIKIGKRKPIDIGSIAYTRRVATKNIRTKDFSPRGVDLLSLREERLFYIQELVEFI